MPDDFLMGLQSVLGNKPSDTTTVDPAGSDFATGLKAELGSQKKTGAPKPAGSKGPGVPASPELQKFIDTPGPSTSVTKNLFKSLPGAVTDTLGFKDVPETIKGVIKDKPSIASVVSELPGAAAKTLGQVASFILGPIINPAMGITEELTKKPIGHVGSKEFGLDFSSPQTQTKELQASGMSPLEAGANIIAGQAAGAGALVGTAGDFTEVKAPITEPVDFQTGLKEALKTPTKPLEVPKQPGPSSVTLQSGINPRVEEFLKQDVAPKLRSAGAAIKETKDIASPSYASSESLQVADRVRGAKAEVVNASDLERAKNKFTVDFFNKFNDQQNIGNISNYEKSGQFQNAPPGYAEFYKQTTDAAHKLLSETFKDPIGYVENYVRRQFKFGSLADEAKAQTYLANKYRSLSGSKAVTKGRIYDVPLDEALREMKASGIKVEPATTNPELLRQWTIGNAIQSKVYGQMWQSLKSDGLIQFVKSGKNIPSDLIELDDNAAKVFYPNESGAVSGKYYASPEVATVLNNAISKGLEGSKIFQGFRGFSNDLNQVQLGISAFHATFSAINASLSDISLGLKQVLRGNFSEGFKTIGRGTIPGVSFTRDIMKGNDYLKALKDQNPEAVKILEQKINPGGGRLSLDRQYQIKAWDNMKEAWKNNNIIGTAIRVPEALIEKIATPLMQKAIPRIKIGAYLDLVKEVDSRLPETVDAATRSRAYAQAWDSIDNRFGQLVYDNLFWNKTTKDLLMASTRSVGWNLGTIREYVGGLGDIAKMKGLTDRATFALVTPIYVGMLGAVYHYLHTGKMPQTLKDYFEPQNGEVDKNGNNIRIRLPTYMRDVVAYAKDPLGTISHKSSPLLNMIYELATNRNYYGDMIRNTDDPFGKQLEQLGGNILSQFQPFSFQNLSRNIQNKGTVEQGVESFLGVTQAPAADIKSPEQIKLQENYNKIYGAYAPRTPEQIDADKLKSQASQFIKAGDMSSAQPLLDQIRKAGGFKSKLDERLWIKSQRKSTEQKLRGTEKILQFQGR